ncbi:hypothetical protein SAMN04487770_11346 [Butyrivibrio sp. ob235]|uniref:hypothetical protein n=1 Tax=Butyrivibrio sp. ob235 TaxID=1761780 RepID=UPI0008B6332E|nr:hypothetical protein [Butyrivibrio sp. ob235]SEL59965.1 hypothetical protein SAMN04487770_11346 [Butyrivibrio sp. ob235]
MKKKAELFIYTILVLSVLIGIKAVPHAAETKNFFTGLPKRETIAVDEETTIRLVVKSEAESICDVKSNSKKLIVKLVGTGSDFETNRKWYVINAYSKHEGIYKIGYTYKTADSGQKKKTIKVRVTKEKPYMSVKIGDKELYPDKENYLSGNKGKFVVKMTKGYKLKKIEYSKYAPMGEGKYVETQWITTKIKNRSRVEIPNIPYSSIYKRPVGNGVFEETIETITASGELLITYVDKYSKKEKQILFKIYKRLI